MAWIHIDAADTLQNDEVMPLTLGDRQLAVYRSDDTYFVTDNVCTHQYALLSDGYLEDGCIECPLHQARFDIRTGKAMCAPATGDIRTYPVKIEDSRVWVEL
ncbi:MULTISPECIES: non-heme iron oxygenase ferredoxin subunit [unclassified Cupriavidus]|uniref:non-heme iron oxygenase ferredoxin subunit n=1 Tax=Cupriavidus TaxID=106589 RepID=UPI001AE980BF|nr:MULTISPECIES: non-heme iron oxygenase ferredoxin subunit [unclassified Cupriavidus]MBP0620780.1 non-heme iron oxygenase ferredoxin subunit [Cupriavidus sp. LEh25]MBP0636280.1 non-heme iron oxygenase ferredoxin subunit [Cupriavidus sp. AcVe19-6a]MDK2657440.1 non-heme iron oxygenase ferredoxin subunit [Cupriavidus sp. LEh21]